MFEQLPLFPILLFSVVVHEVSHGLVALKLGDPTARDLGRLTLNPIPHIDMFGSIIVPAISLLSAGTVFIAWAKPVPINPSHFTQPRRDDLLVSIAGPCSNIILAIVCSLMVVALQFVLPFDASADESFGYQVGIFFMKMFFGGAYLNIVLAVFNLIPVPPLDGSHVVASVLPENLASHYRRVGFFGIIAVIVMMQVPAVSNGFQSIIGLVFEPLRMLMTALRVQPEFS